MPNPASGPHPQLENVPPGEEARIDHIAVLTGQQLDRRYAGKRVLRGVHPKDHGCVEATFTVDPDLPADYQVGVFRKPGEQFRAVIRYSNAAPLITPDSPVEPRQGGGSGPAHGSRGMAIKLYGVGGNRLVPGDRERTQDFLMINQPIFAFANVEDYEIVSQLLVDNNEDARPFFARVQSPDPAVKARAIKSAGIIGRIKSLMFPPAWQAPPLSPLDNRYFSAAPFLFGDGKVMKFSCTPVNPKTGELGEAISQADYLRAAMRERMAQAGGKEICFDFQVQVRSADSLAATRDTDIEDMCTLWDEATYPFVTVARITIPTPQDISAPERTEFCETLFYTPWHGLEDHRPLGGINRMRLKVYDASAEKRGCPFSPDLPTRQNAEPRGPSPSANRGAARGQGAGGKAAD
ncbi:MAG TPA: hypothetical protein VGB08_11015 [Allosphingosinicella sp.]